MRLAAGVATSTVGGLILALFVDASVSVILVLFSLAVVAITALLAHGFVLTGKIAQFETARILFLARAHIVAHIVPLSYLIAHYLGQSTFALNLVYLIPFVFFYYSGTRLWKMLFAQFGTKMYLLFVFGNTWMMAGLIVLSMLGLRFGPEPFSGSVLGYFAVHFLLSGITIMQIERDLQRQSSREYPLLG